jgi:hypothetical protein
MLIPESTGVTIYWLLRVNEHTEQQQQQQQQQQQSMIKTNVLDREYVFFLSFPDDKKVMATITSTWH